MINLEEKEQGGYTWSERNIRTPDIGIRKQYIRRDIRNKNIINCPLGKEDAKFGRCDVFHRIRPLSHPQRNESAIPFRVI